MPDYLASGWALLDFSGALAADATGTTGSGLIGTPTTPDAGADRLSLYIKDDDDQLKDADIETGTLSVLTNDLTIGGVTYRAGSNIESDHQSSPTICPRSPSLSAASAPVRLTPAATSWCSPYPGSRPDQTVTFDGISDGPNAPYDTICFAQGTKIATPSGDRTTESLRTGDEIVTKMGTDRILWIRSRHFSAFDLCNNRQ